MTVLNSSTIRLSTNCGDIFVSLDIAQNSVVGCRIHYGKAGGCAAATSGGISSLLTAALRSGMPAEDAVLALSGISCHLGGNTCMEAIAKAIRYTLAHLATGKDINDLIFDEECAEAEVGT